MAAALIDGRAAAEALRARVGIAADFFRAASGRAAGLATVLVGEDPASSVYIRSKIKATHEANMHGVHHPLPADTREEQLLALVEQLNRDPSVDGILVQLPLPDQIDTARVIAAIDPDKDVDGFHVVNAGRLAVGDPDALVPCTPLGCLHLLKSHLGSLSGLEAVVIGRSNIVGKPMAALLLAESCTVTIAHSRTSDLPEVCRRADILVAAVGRAEMVRGDWIKPGACLIDVGINRVAGAEPGKTRIVGDVAFDEAREVAGAITPVPGGVGPMTIAMLLRNTLVAAHRRANLAVPEDL
ncbi:bifunctional methylenetetrahydrofolate dehydrogenase/methenyltetrahydrofolate cyclohydrolase FolD [Sphingomonas sp. BN140010]|uniref:Bifunctional protein FolD n=1 Tax=Sphingomonas arvum TaxID=2992113 RepID=A0ABT3JFJ0_9SPHN|nr:bifunctional methylenetetrahydrofolate dehydrogenase/methenyltetrahydrofolate cyclohydrolase FolD [Sphingomonas sp. BN140010]MCW3797843.1 bifunctional methylenetetrahydrofolate dehydrogenase/methenyltetrahydrofolate cyclohydrolase FolD [Sphingomonas sp. BN140010]